MSGRGGTTGRAAGCPASGGRGWGRKGAPGVGAGVGVPGVAACAAGADGVGRAIGCAGNVTEAGGIGEEDAWGGGSGCRGPDKIWPGRGVIGTGRAGTGPVRSGGWIGEAPPAESGGLNGAGLLRTGSSGVEMGVVTEAS